MSKLSILGLYRYGESVSSDLFKNLSLPDGIDTDLVENTILEQCAEFELVYPEFEYMQFSIGLWSKRWNRTFTKWYEALQINYEPLNNYDRTETWTETDTGSASSSDSASSESDNFVTAYNSDELHEQSRNEAASTGSQTAESTNTIVKTGRAYGNIGVTTSQQMLESELEIARFNLVQQIVDVFKTEYCILVY